MEIYGKYNPESEQQEITIVISPYEKLKKPIGIAQMLLDMQQVYTYYWLVNHGRDNDADEYVRRNGISLFDSEAGLSVIDHLRDNILDGSDTKETVIRLATPKEDNPNILDDFFTTLDSKWGKGRINNQVNEKSNHLKPD